jgi:hypothetical protein
LFSRFSRSLSGTEPEMPDTGRTGPDKKDPITGEQWPGLIPIGMPGAVRVAGSHPAAAFEKDDLFLELAAFTSHFAGICMIGPHVLYLGKIPDQLLLFFCSEMFVGQPFEETCLPFDILDRRKKRDPVPPLAVPAVRMIFPILSFVSGKDFEIDTGTGRAGPLERHPFQDTLCILLKYPFEHGRVTIPANPGSVFVTGEIR